MKLEEIPEHLKSNPATVFAGLLFLAVWGAVLVAGEIVYDRWGASIFVTAGATTLIAGGAYMAGKVAGRQQAEQDHYDGLRGPPRIRVDEHRPFFRKGAERP